MLDRTVQQVQESAVASLHAEAVSGEAVTWKAVLRWAGVILPITMFAFWAGVQLTSISQSQQMMRDDMVSVRNTVKEIENKLDHLNQRAENLDRRLWKVEQKQKREVKR